MRIGIVGSGKIVIEALNAIKEIPEISSSAICGREESLDKLNIIANKFNIEKIYTNYEKFLDDDNIDIIYIGIVNNLHFQYTKKALKKGKHVICEKPFTSNFEEIKLLANIAREKKLFLFEAITMLYLPNFNFLRENLFKLGDIKLVQCNYSQYSSRYDSYKNGIVLPAFDANMSGGSLYDINIYNIHFVAKLFGMPKEINYIANKGFNGIDTSGVLVLQYDGFTAVCCGAKDSQSENHATVQGINGYLKINSPVNSCLSVDFFLEGNVKKYNKNIYENRMIDEFKAFKIIFENKNFDECYSNLSHSEIVMKILTKARKDADILFPIDL